MYTQGVEGVCVRNCVTSVVLFTATIHHTCVSILPTHIYMYMTSEHSGSNAHTHTHTHTHTQYYHHRYGLDFRSLRFPGVISPNMPGGGTTDYAIHIFYNVLKNGHYDCFLREDSRLPMIYIDDCLQVGGVTV